MMIKRLVFAMFVVVGLANAKDIVYFSFGVNLGAPLCVRERVVYVDKEPAVIVVRHRPVYYYYPSERVIIVEKQKRWKKHKHWDWD
ncbi:MAG: hypothetical protein D6699_03595 [Aquificota bacterium]|nr:MAG: hypothetical protein D6699_03595 [Aquificota bacterium]